MVFVEKAVGFWAGTVCAGIVACSGLSSHHRRWSQTHLVGLEVLWKTTKVVVPLEQQTVVDLGGNGEKMRLHYKMGF